MLQVYEVRDQNHFDNRIKNSFCAKFGWDGYTFLQPDFGKVTFPAKFVVIEDSKIKTATIEFLIGE